MHEFRRDLYTYIPKYLPNFRLCQTEHGTRGGGRGEWHKTEINEESRPNEQVSFFVVGRVHILSSLVTFGGNFGGTRQFVIARLVATHDRMKP